MALVDYPDSESSEDEISPLIETDVAQSIDHGTLKRKRDHDAHSTLPPLPVSFHDLYASNSRTASQDDPGLHAGRQRLTPHVEGNWPTHVYIECEAKPQRQDFTQRYCTTANGKEGILQRQSRAVYMSW